MVGFRSHGQKQQFILFSLFRHLRHRFRCYLSLELLSNRNKQKALTGPGQNTPSDCRCAAFCFCFFSWMLGRNRSAHKGFIRRINRYTKGTAASRRFTPEVVSLAAFTRRRRVEPVTVGLRRLLLRPFQVQAAGIHLGPFRQRGPDQGPWFTHGNRLHLRATVSKKFTAFKK